MSDETEKPALAAAWDGPRMRREADGSLVRNAVGLPIVQRGQDVHRVLVDLDEALADPKTGDRRLFQRSGELVLARGLTAEDARRLRIAFAPESVVLSSLRSASLVARITEHVEYGYWGFENRATKDGTVERKKVWKTDLPSNTVLSAFLGKPFWAHIRPIRGVSVTPIIHLDGSIVASGYDPSTEYYVAPNITLPPIPDNPTRADAEAALAELVEPFAEFPFETEDQRYGPVALSLTLALRPVIRGNVPAFVTNAPQKNCGKSLSTKGACVIATGCIPASNTWAKLEEEQEKMIGAAADAGADVLFFDNVQEGAIIGGAPLDKVLTCDGQNSFRVLGQSKLKMLPWTAVVAFTCNKGRIGGDTDRRAVVATLIRPDVPRATYKHDDLLGYIQQERPRLLGAAFTLIRAWLAAGAPAADIRRLDSFEQWAKTVAAMIRWAGGGDVRELVRDTEGTDADDQEFAMLRGIHEWMNISGKPDFTVKELVESVFRKLVSESAFDELRAAIESIAGFEGKGEARKLDVRRFGKRLSRMKDLLQGCYRLKQNGTGDGGVARWTVVRVQGVQWVQSNHTRERVGGEKATGDIRDRSSAEPMQSMQPMAGETGETFSDYLAGEGIGAQ